MITSLYSHHPHDKYSKSRCELLSDNHCSKASWQINAKNSLICFFKEIIRGPEPMFKLRNLKLHKSQPMLADFPQLHLWSSNPIMSQQSSDLLFYFHYYFFLNCLVSVVETHQNGYMHINTGPISMHLLQGCWLNAIILKALVRKTVNTHSCGWHCERGIISPETYNLSKIKQGKHRLGFWFQTWLFLYIFLLLWFDLGGNNGPFFATH